MNKETMEGGARLNYRLEVVLRNNVVIHVSSYASARNAGKRIQKLATELAQGQRSVIGRMKQEYQAIVKAVLPTVSITDLIFLHKFDTSTAKTFTFRIGERVPNSVVGLRLVKLA